MEVLKYRKDANSEWQSIIAIKGEPGKDGTMSFEDLTEEQKASLKGEPGQDGYTPVKGVDYFDGKDGKDGSDYILTDADKTEIANLVLAAIPSSEGVSY